MGVILGVDGLDAGKLTPKPSCGISYPLRSLSVVSMVRRAIFAASIGVVGVKVAFGLGDVN